MRNEAGKLMLNARLYKGLTARAHARALSAAPTLVHALPRYGISPLRAQRG